MSTEGAAMIDLLDTLFFFGLLFYGGYRFGRAVEARKMLHEIEREDAQARG